MPTFIIPAQEISQNGGKIFLPSAIETLHRRSTPRLDFRTKRLHTSFSLKHFPFCQHDENNVTNHSQPEKRFSTSCAPKLELFWRRHFFFLFAPDTNAPLLYTYTSQRGDCVYTYAIHKKKARQNLRDDYFFFVHPIYLLRFQVSVQSAYVQAVGSKFRAAIA